MGRWFGIAMVLATVAAAPANAAMPACSAGALVVWLNTQGGVAAGTAYYKLEFTNLSTHACTLRGHPGVSAIAPSGRQLGSPGNRNPARGTRTVTLARGGSHLRQGRDGDAAHPVGPARIGISSRAVTFAPELLAPDEGLRLQSGPGRDLVFKVTGEDNGGAFDYFVVEVSPHGGPPLHVHHE